MARFLLRPPTKFKPFSYTNNAVLALGRPKVNINRDFKSLNRLRYFYGGHVSNDVMILTVVKPQMGWEWLTWAKYKIPVILCLNL